MTFDQVMAFYGSRYKLSKILKNTNWPASAQAIGQWGIKNHVPADRQLQLQSLSKGKLKACLE